MKKDNEILSACFDHLFKYSCLENIKDTVKEQLDITLDENWLRYYKMLEATEFVKKGTYSRGPHVVLYLNNEGMQMMMEYGSYLSFLNSKTKSVSNTDKLQALNIMIIRLKVISVIVGIIAALVTLFLGIQNHQKDKKIEILKNLLHKNNIEIPK